MKIVFVATGDIALPSFRGLLESGKRPILVITQPDKPVGRHQVMTSPRIKEEAALAGIPVWQPEKIGEVSERLRELAPDVIVVMAYGQILKEDVLAVAKLAIINLHASILPKYRGAACIQAAIAAGDKESGVTSMHMVRALDAGDMILCHTVELAADETGGRLHDRLAEVASGVLEETLVRLADGTAPRVAQDEAQSSYVSKLERNDGKLDWTQEAEVLERQVRAYDPWPGTFSLAQEKQGEKRVKIFPPVAVVDAEMEVGELRIEEAGLVVGCGRGGLRLSMVQPEGGKRMTVGEYVRGRSPSRMR